MSDWNPPVFASPAQELHVWASCLVLFTWVPQDGVSILGRHAGTSNTLPTEPSPLPPWQDNNLFLSYIPFSEMDILEFI